MFDISRYPYVSLDTEATGLKWPKDKMFGFSLAAPDGAACYHDIREEPDRAGDLNYELSMYRGRVIFHNCSFDYKMLHSAGIFVPLELCDDTVIRACLIDEHTQSFSLDYLSEKHLGDRKEGEIYAELATLFGGRASRGVQMKNLWRAPSGVVRPYAVKDALLTVRLWEWQEAEIERQGIRRIVDFERRVMPSLIKAEMRGIRVDTKRAEQAMAKLTLEIDERQSELDALVGFQLNTNSPKQVKQVFSPTQGEDGEWYTDSGIWLPKTDSGNPSIDAEVLRGMDNDRRARLILDVRSTIKTRDTFLGGHVLGHEVGGRVYPSINQNKGEDAGTGTGRLSYTEPALQQIPSRNKVVAATVKPVFLPDEDCDWLSLDMNSFEVRVFAHLVNNSMINAAYWANELMDLHQYVADLTGLPRNATYSGQANAKQLNLSAIFNSGNGALADKMGMPWEWNSFKKGDVVFKYKKAGPEAEAVIQQYHDRIQGVKELAARAKAAAEAHGYVQTKHGRRLRFPRKFKTYKASGLAIQATAADINKEMWLIADQMESETGNHLIMNTHDSYEINVKRGTDPLRLKKELQERIRATVPWFRIPLVIDLNGVGKDYWDAIK